MAKKGMRRPAVKRPKNDERPVPEIQGKAKQSGEKANPPPQPAKDGDSAKGGEEPWNRT